jgi:hypothetical protein
MLTKIKKFTNWQAALILSLVGLSVYADGLGNTFVGDDSAQIVNNPPVHSITNIRLFFEGGTFYVSGHAGLIGSYYRPLMTTVFSLIYTIFGARPFYFHILQLAIYIASAYIFYLFLGYSFKPIVALSLALVFLVHPLNSQVVFEIASLQDVLFFFFGMSALWLLLRFKSYKSLTLVTLCLVLSLVSKETAVLFVAMAIVYLCIWDRKRFVPLLGMLVIPVITYIILRAHAIGVLVNPRNAPIDNLSLAGRLLTDPSIVLFYITKFIFPWKLASEYYWIHSNYSARYVLLPFVIDCVVIGVFVYAGYRLRSLASRSMFYTYLFFGAWTALGMLIVLQLSPLDMTASVTWFYFPMVGLLGMLGVISTVLPFRMRPLYCYYGLALIIVVFGASSLIDGLHWKNQTKLYEYDVAVNADDFTAYDGIAASLFYDGHVTQSEVDIKRAIAIYPYATNYNTLGLIYFQQQKYGQADAAFIRALSYTAYQQIYDNIGLLTLWYGNAATVKVYLTSALQKYPNDASLVQDLAVLYYRDNDVTEARRLMQAVYQNGEADPAIYQHIMSSGYSPLRMPAPNFKK